MRQSIPTLTNLQHELSIGAHNVGRNYLSAKSAAIRYIPTYTGYWKHEFHMATHGSAVYRVHTLMIMAIYSTSGKISAELINEITIEAFACFFTGFCNDSNTTTERAK
jgi:hypothetical protein